MFICICLDNIGYLLCREIALMGVFLPSIWSIIPSFSVVVLMHKFTFLLKMFSNSEWYEWRDVEQYCSLNAKINIGLIFSILFLFLFHIFSVYMFYLFCFVLLLIVIVLCELIRCVTVYFLSKYTHLRLISFSIARAYSWRLISSIAWMIMTW